jgi:CRISPR/Cas system CSM-associated protein Csm4 (group 5 of RAMP superfamily)
MNKTIKKNKCDNFCKTRYLKLRQKKLIQSYKTNKTLIGSRSKKEIQKIIKNIKNGKIDKEDIINRCKNTYCNEECKKNCICPICKNNFNKFKKYGAFTAISHLSDI